MHTLYHTSSDTESGSDADACCDTDAGNNTMMPTPEMI